MSKNLPSPVVYIWAGGNSESLGQYSKGYH